VPGVPAGLTSTTFDPPLFDIFALVRRRGTRLSPATRALTDALGAHLPGG